MGLVHGVVQSDGMMKYDKGENRRKHVGNAPDAQMILESGVLVGKCPKGFSGALALGLVQNGIQEFRKTAPENPCRIWNYYDGAIYAARSQDGGETWHGYPCPSEDIPRTILRELEARAIAAGQGQNIKHWLKKRWTT
jgi:hypothetical protein